LGRGDTQNTSISREGTPLFKRFFFGGSAAVGKTRKRNAIHFHAAKSRTLI